MAAPDPQGGLPWGLRIVKTTSGYGCIEVGRVLDGRFGGLGEDGSFNDDGEFHAVPAWSTRRTPPPARGSTSGAGSSSTSPRPWAPRAARSSSRGCVSSRAFAPVLLRMLERHPADSDLCPAVSNRTLIYGLLGPDAESISYTLDGRAHVETTVGPQGAYLIVGSGARSADPELGDLPFAAGRLPVDTPITTIRYRGGVVCRLLGAPPQRAHARLPARRPPRGLLGGADVRGRKAQVSAMRAIRTKPVTGLCAAVAVLAAGLALGACGGTAPKPGYPSGYHPVWLCRPGLAHNPCVTSLQTGVFSATGKLERVYTPQVPANPPVDCFYVYPTVSSEFSMLSDLKIQPPETDVALYQAAYFRPACRMYAPMYHQVTEIGAANLGLLTLKELNEQYDSVLWAFRYYLAHYNHGRPFVLIGHSQGAFTVNALVRRVIDPNVTLRRQMLSAMLFGGGVTVKAGKLIGGDYKHIPGCTSPSELGCVMTYSSFNGAPPVDSVFGHTPWSPTDAQLPLLPGQQILCTNPAALGGGSGYLDSVFPLAFPPRSATRSRLRRRPRTGRRRRGTSSATPTGLTANSPTAARSSR